MEPSIAMLVAAGIEAATASEGLVDAAVIDFLEDAGYAGSRTRAKPASLSDALAWAPVSATGDRVRNTALGRRIGVNTASGEVTRPVGVRIDSGGLGKGLAADLAAKHLTGFSSFAVDCGGDLRIGGTAGLPRRVERRDSTVEGIDRELRGPRRRRGDKRASQADLGAGRRLLPPPDRPGQRGLPAWTGIVQATALAATATRAETLAKTAILAGPQRARELLAAEGGAIVLDSGEVEVIGDVTSWTEVVPDAVPVGAG